MGLVVVTIAYSLSQDHAYLIRFQPRGHPDVLLEGYSRVVVGMRVTLKIGLYLSCVGLNHGVIPSVMMIELHLPGHGEVRLSFSEIKEK